MKLLVIVFLFIFSTGCKRESLNTIEEKEVEIAKFILNKLDLQYYPSFSDLLGVEIDFDQEKIKVYNPTDYYSYIELESFEVHISLKDLIKIDSIVKTISCNELENPQAGYALDGMHLETTFYFADGSILNNSPGNSSKKIYNVLKSEVLEIVMKYNKSSNNEIIIEKIRKYDEDVPKSVYESIKKTII